jgi:hypothetical protein
MQHEKRAAAWLLSALVVWAAVPLVACSAHDDPDPTPRKSSEALSECPDDTMPVCDPGYAAACSADGTWQCVYKYASEGSGTCSTCRRWL